MAIRISPGYCVLMWKPPRKSMVHGWPRIHTPCASAWNCQPRRKPPKNKRQRPDSMTIHRDIVASDIVHLRARTIIVESPHDDLTHGALAPAGYNSSDFQHTCKHNL